MRRLVPIVAAIPVLALAIASAVSLPTKLIYNGSPSAPVGFYWIDDHRAERRDFVLVRVPDRVQNLVEERRYLPPDVPLIKRVAGADGDVVCRRDREIIIDGVTVTVARYEDALGRDMPVWTGCHVLGDRRVFLLQQHSQSFDSRYFGPVDRSLIIGRATYLRPPWRKHDPY